MWRRHAAWKTLLSMRDSGQTWEKQGRQKDISLKNLKGSLSVLCLFSHFQSFFFVFWIRASLMFPQAGPKLLPVCVRTLLSQQLSLCIHTSLTSFAVLVLGVSFSSHQLPMYRRLPHTILNMFSWVISSFFFLTILCMYILVLSIEQL